MRFGVGFVVVAGFHLFKKICCEPKYWLVLMLDNEDEAVNKPDQDPVVTG